jgi:hypothetical protein
MEDDERLRKLCEQAAIEQDHSKLVELVRQINEALEAKNKRLHPEQHKDENPSSD